ncbi:ribosome silencing factor [Myxococcaceae bacterium GXIMD 01537]
MALKKSTKKTAKKKTATKAPARKKVGAKGAAKGAAKPAKKPAAKRPARKKALPAAPKAAPAENPRARALANKMGELLLDKKAKDVLVLDVRGMTSYADYFVVASGESDRQVSAMAEGVLTNLKETENGLRPIGSEGLENGQWVLLDYGEVVAHLFLDEVRAFYDLEGLWADAPREKLT